MVLNINKTNKKSNKNTKICIYCTSLLSHGGGAERSLINLAVFLRNRGMEVALVTLDEKNNRILAFLLSMFYLRRIKITKRINDNELIDLLDGVEYLPTSIFRLSKVVSRFDSIYSLNEVLDLFLLNASCSTKNKILILGIHTAVHYPITSNFQSKLHNYLYTGWVYKYLCKDVKSFIVHNRDDLFLMKKLFPEKNVHLAHLPLRVPGLKPPDRKNKDSILKILFVGRLKEQKGIDVLIDVIKSIARKDIFRHFEIRIIGSGDESYTREIQSLERNYDNVQFLGNLPNEVVYQHYGWADVCLIPSRYETTNKVAQEAGWSGVVVLATNIPGPREVIIPNRTGYLLDLNAAAFVDKLIKLLRMKIKEPSKFYSIGNRAHDYIINNFDEYKANEHRYKIISRTLCVN